MKRIRYLLFSLLLVCCTMGAADVVSADTLALTFTGGTLYDYVYAPVPNTIGWEFTLSGPITVTKLGFYDLGKVDFANVSPSDRIRLTPDGDGLVESHDVAIWDRWQNQLIAATVTNGNPLDQNYRWAAVAPYTLAAGTYRIGASINNDKGNDGYVSGTSTKTTASPVSYVGGAYLLGSYGYPAELGYTNNGRFGPNFTFNAVPVPAAVWLLGSGLLGLVGIRRKIGK